MGGGDREEDRGGEPVILYNVTSSRCIFSIFPDLGADFWFAKFYKLI